MRRSIALGLVLAAPAVPSAAAQEPADPAPLPHVAVGIGDQSPELFNDPRFRATGIRHVRLIVPYNLVRAGGWQLASTDAWLGRARELGLEPLVSFAHSAGRRRYLPTVAQYAARVREFRDRYPWVHEFSTWNEANHSHVQPTGANPRRTAAFYRELRRQCLAAGCRVVAVDILAWSWKRTWRWVRKFRRAAGPGPHIWGIHNYPDANRLRLGTTQRFLRRTKRDEIWFTETGGIVRFEQRWRHDERRAARSVRHAFRLAQLSPRVTRMYLYNWRFDPLNRRWDSGFLAADGTPRRAFFALLDGLALERFRPPPPPIVDAPPPDRPVTLDPDQDD
jgi:hypothetical protein